MSRIKTSKFRVSFCAVFKPEAMDPKKDEPKYSLTMMFEKDDPFLKTIENEIKRAIKEEWGSKAPKTLKICLRDGAEKGHIDGFSDDVKFITARSKYKPGLVDSDLNDIFEEEEFYGGCYARASIEIYAYNNPTNKGVSATLYNIQKLEDGDRLGGKILSAAEEFGESDNVPNDASSEDIDLNAFL